MSVTEVENKPTKTTLVLPPDLYGDVWDMIAAEKKKGRRATMQDLLQEAVQEYVDRRKKKDEVA